METILRLQRQYGNHYVQRFLALSRKGEGEAGVSPEVESAIERSRGGGHALDHGVRGDMESAFGADFSGVRVHTGGEAHQLNREVSAVAFTTGQDIFFSDGAYNPGTQGGNELLAHELTHVVQQGGASAIAGEDKSEGVQTKLTVGQPDDEYEKEADRVARAVTHPQDKSGDVFALPGEGPDSDDQGDLLAGGESCVQRANGTDAGAAPAACAHPINFALGPAHNNGPDAIQIPISWDSSTGNLADLGSCTIREVVSYDAIPNPPFLWNPPNPTILTVPAASGVAQDTHSYPPGLQTGITDPRQAGTMVAHQVYQSRCTGPGCSGVWENLPGQAYTITRSVFPEYVWTNPWRYSINKTGVANGSREVAVPPPAAAPGP